MPLVPGYERTERLRPAYRQGIDVQSSPEDFGAAIGRGLSKLGGGLESASGALAAVQAKDDETAAKQADMDLQKANTDLLYNPEKGFSYKTGEDAVKGWDAYNKQAEENRQKYGEHLSPRARQMYDRAAAQRTLEAQQTGMIHTGNERKKWYTGTAKARADSFGDEAVSAYADPKKADAKIASGLIELRGLGDDLGKTPDEMKVLEKDFVSSVRARTALHIGDIGKDPIAADKYLDDHKDQITPDDYLKAKNALHEAVISSKGARGAGEIFKRQTGKESVPKGMKPGRLDVQGSLEGQPVAIVASRLLRHDEGFSSTAYWDVNHWRGGYGSDTITRADGSVERVTRGTTFTRADAERDLARRTGVVANHLRSQVGDEAWNRMSVAARSAAVAVSYNYGQHEFRPRGDLAGLVTAIRSGDHVALANAIRARANDNGGINAKRRNAEANFIMTGKLEGGEGTSTMSGGSGGDTIGASRVDTTPITVTAQASGVAGVTAPDEGAPTTTEPEERDSVSDYLIAEEYINSIKDPEEAAAVRTKYNAAINAMSKAQEQAQKAAQTEMFSVIENGGTPDDVPLQTRQTAGLTAVKSAWEYHEQRTKRGDPVTDPAIYYFAKRKAAEDPEGYSQMNLMDLRKDLSKQDFEELTRDQAAALADIRKAKDKGTDIVSGLAQANSLFESAYPLAGLDNKQRVNIEKLRGQFREGMVRKLEGFYTKEGRGADPMQVEQMAAALMMPTIWHKESGAGFWGKLDAALGGDGYFAGMGAGDEEHKAFEAPYRPDGTKVELNLQYTDVPIDSRTIIATNLGKRLGRAPTPEEIVTEYENYRMGAETELFR